MEKGKYDCAYTGELELTPEQFNAARVLREIEMKEKLKDAEQKDMLTVLAHPLDPSKPDLEFKDVFDIMHLFGNDRGDGIFHQTLRLLSFGECKCLLHYLGSIPETCEKEHTAKRDWISLNDYTVEIAMQKGEQNNG